LAQVARGRHDEDESCTNITVLTDSTIAAAFRPICYLIEVGAQSMGWDHCFTECASRPRELVLTAIREVYTTPETHSQQADSDDWVEWLSLVSFMLDQILDDREFLTADMFLDIDATDSSNVKDQLGIPEGYFTATQADPTPEDLEVARIELKRICWRPWVWRSTTVCALADAYYCLLIRPCDEAISDQEEAACGLVLRCA
jgi:hypothetical protein